MDYPIGSKITITGTLRAGRVVYFPSSNPFGCYKLSLASLVPEKVVPPAVEINDIVSLNGAAYEGMTFKLIGVDGDRAWVRNRDTGLRATIDYKDINFVARKGVGE